MTVLSPVAVPAATVIATAMFCGCAQHQWGEAAEQVSYNADINICMLVNRFCAVGGCAITGGCASGDSDCDGDVLWLCWRQGG